MKRVGLLLLFGLLASSCSKAAPTQKLLPPWEVLVTGVRPASFAEPPALIVCEADGKGCGPVAPGLKLGGNKLIRTQRGVGEFRLDADTKVDVAEGSELLLEDDAGRRSLELRAGGISLTRASADSGSLLVRMVDRTVELVGRASIVAQLDNINRGQMFATQGVVNVAEPPGAPIPVRQFHPGEGAVFERKAPPDLHAVFSGVVSRFRQSVLAVPDVPPPPPPQVVAQPRGLGTMTARAPGTTQVISGVRLAQHRVRAVVRDGVAQTEVEEVFRNDTDRVLEGRYVFPLPADAAISGLTLLVNDKPVEGELVEKKRAAAIFKGIVDDTVRPRDPALLEWVKGSEFSLKIFPIPARGSRTVTLRYQQVLGADGPRQAYVYPLSLGADRRTPIDELSIDVELSDGGQAVQGLVASGYAAKLTPGASSTHVSMKASASSPDHDFVVSFKRPVPSAIVASTEPGFVAIRLRAELPPDMPQPVFRRTDRVIVVDASHSQSKESLAAAREVALGAIRSLEPDERFALLLCDSGCTAVPASGLAPAAGKALDDAQAALTSRKPTGGSDFAGALIAASRLIRGDTPGQIVYVGDGAASAGELSAASIARRARPHLAAGKLDLRLLGVGATLDEVTLAGVARELGGSYQPVVSSGPLAEQIEVVTAGLRSPLLVAPALDVAGLTELEPRVLPSLRLGEELVVVGKSSGSAPLAVTLRGTLDRIPYALSRPVVAKPPGSAPAFAARLWAQSRIAALQSSSDPAALKEIIALSQRFRVMSRETSWLVLENEQMFAEFGIPRTKPEPEAGGAETPDARAALSQELDRVEPGAPEPPSASAPVDSSPAKKEKAESEAPASPTKPRSVPSPEPPGPILADPLGTANGAGPGGSGSSGGLGGLGSTGSGSSVGGDSKVAGPRGNAAVGTPSISGGTVANAQRVVAGMRAGFRNCYQRGLAENPEAAGRGQLLLRIDAGGTVSLANFAPSGNLPASVSACVTARARAAQFDPPSSGNATIVFPITFTKESGPVSSAPPGIIIARPVPSDTAVTRPGNDAFVSEGQAALDKLRAELAATPDSRKRHEALVRGLLLRGRFTQALTAAERFVELDPDLAAAREVLAYAAAATGDSKRAVDAVDTLTENDPRSAKAQGRAARAFEAQGDEIRACAHWRAVAELLPTSDSALYESLRCRARALADGQNALADARAVPRPGPLLQRLIPLLVASQAPAYEKSTNSAGQFEVSLTCEPQASCPYLIAITPTGTVMSPWTPGLSRSSSKSFAFSGLLTGSYRVLRVGGVPGATGKVEVRALNARNSFDLVVGQTQTMAITQVTLAPAGLGLLGIGSLSRF